MGRHPRTDAICRRLGGDGVARGGDRAWRRARTGLAPRASGALHRRDQREGERPPRSPLSGASRRTRRPIPLSRPRAAGRLRHARPQAPSARRASLCRLARTLADRRAEGVQRRRRHTREAGRRMGRASRQAAVAAGRDGRGQDRRHRRTRAALGDVARRLAQRRSRPHPFFRHRPVRHRRSALWRHQSRRPRPPRQYGACGRSAAGDVRNNVRPDAIQLAKAAPPVARPTGRTYRPDMGLPISLPEQSRRAFWARLYARRRLFSHLAAPFAPLHYALIGERRGYRPDAFFDPSWFRPHANIAQDASRGLLEAYLAHPEPDAPSPSAEFEHGWYVSQNPDWSQSYPHPFLHFLERGLRAGRRPRPDIDVEFVRDITRSVKPRSLEEASFRVFDRTLSEGEMGPPLTRQELRARQDRFYAAGQLRIEREAPHPEHDVLVFVQCGRGFDAAYLEEPRAHDVLLNYYHESDVHPKADIAVVQAGTKTTAIRRLLELRPDLLLRYQAVLVLDDDVEIDAEGIEALFRAMTAEKLDLAQPALTADSATAYAFLKKPSANAGVTRGSSVEIMAPALTRRALEYAGWAFAESVSGWGSDLLLGPAVRAACGPMSVGVIGSVAVRHPAPVDLSAGAFYAFLRRYGVDPGHEANRIAVDFGVERFLRRLAPGEAGETCQAPLDGETA